MTAQIALTLGIIVGALVLFGTDKLRVDLVALLVSTDRGTYRPGWSRRSFFGIL